MASTVSGSKHYWAVGTAQTVWQGGRPHHAIQLVIFTPGSMGWSLIRLPWKIDMWNYLPGRNCWKRCLFWGRQSWKNTFMIWFPLKSLFLTLTLSAFPAHLLNFLYRQTSTISISLDRDRDRNKSWCIYGRGGRGGGLEFSKGSLVLWLQFHEHI